VKFAYSPIIYIILWILIVWGCILAFLWHHAGQYDRASFQMITSLFMYNIVKK